MDKTLPNSFTLNLYNTDNTGTRDVSLFELGASGVIPSDVVVQEVGSANYSSILNSQTGAVYLIKGITIQINQAPNEDSKQRQILKPFRFKKKDVNGNEYEIQKVQVIDPYQYQYSYEWVNLIDDGESYCFDGNTAFKYNLEPLTGVNITFNYVEAKNGDYDSVEGLLKQQEERDLVQELEKDSVYATEKELDIQNNAVDTNKKKKPKKWHFWILGATAVYFLYTNLLTNQKR